MCGCLALEPERGEGSCVAAHHVLVVPRTSIIKEMGVKTNKKIVVFCTRRKVLGVQTTSQIKSVGIILKTLNCAMLCDLL